MKKPSSNQSTYSINDYIDLQEDAIAAASSAGAVHVMLGKISSYSFSVAMAGAAAAVALMYGGAGYIMGHNPMTTLLDSLGFTQNGKDMGLVGVGAGTTISVAGSAVTRVIKDHLPVNPIAEPQVVTQHSQYAKMRAAMATHRSKNNIDITDVTPDYGVVASPIPTYQL